jgi:hypothetical protein
MIGAPVAEVDAIIDSYLCQVISSRPDCGSELRSPLLAVMLLPIEDSQIAYGLTVSAFAVAGGMSIHWAAVLDTGDV